MLLEKKKSQPHLSGFDNQKQVRVQRDSTHFALVLLHVIIALRADILSARRNGSSTARRTVGQDRRKCKETSNLDVIVMDMGYNDSNHVS